MTTTKKAWNIIDIINWGTDYLKKNRIENAQREMEWFLCNVLGYERIDLYLKFENLLKESELEQLRSMVKRRVTGEPFQHIIGKAPFYGRDFIVNSNVLIPRTETGILINRMKKNEKVSSLLDVGTGSGCIAITCALENLSKKIYATDICSKALTVAHENIQLHDTEQIQTINHNILNRGFIARFDVVISNPPYISIDEMDSLQSEVRGYDPEKALTDGSDGYVFYRRFSELFDDLLNPFGFMLLEIGGNAQKEGVEKIFSDAGLQTEVFRDNQDDFRVVEVRK